MTERRTRSYGEARSFRGLERLAIQRRQWPALKALEQLSSRPGHQAAKVLELGCGYYGRNLRLLHEKFPEADYTGVDLSVAQADAKGFRLLVGNLADWQPNQTYDLVLSLAVIEHLLDPLGHLELIAAGLKPEGIAVLTTPTPLADLPLRLLGRLGLFDYDEIDDHKAYFSKVGLHSLGQQVGLTLDSYQKASLGMNHVVHFTHQSEVAHA